MKLIEEKVIPGARSGEYLKVVSDFIQSDMKVARIDDINKNRKKISIVHSLRYAIQAAGKKDEIAIALRNEQIFIFKKERSQNVH